MSSALSLRKNTTPSLPIVSQTLAGAQEVIEAHWQKHDREPRWAYADCTPSDLEACIRSNQYFLDELPTTAALKDISNGCKSYPRTSTLNGITEAIATLVGSFPHANMPDPRTYMRMLIADVQGMNYPDVVVSHACRVMRRTLQYPPPIASFLAACDQQMQRWHAYGGYADRLIRARETFERAITKQQQILETMNEKQNS